VDLSSFASVASPDSAGSGRVRTLLSGFIISYVLTVLSIALARYLWGTAGFDLVIVGLGWPHVILGFLFYANKIVKNEGRQRVSFYWLMALTLAISFVHTLRPITGLIYMYFVYHAFRDEIFIYYQRLTRHRYAGPIFGSRSGRALLATAVLLNIAIQLQFRPTLRTVKVAASQLQAAKNLVSFPPVENSRGREYHLWLASRRSLRELATAKYATPAGVSHHTQPPTADNAAAKSPELRLSYQTADSGPPGGTRLHATSNFLFRLPGDRLLDQTIRPDADNMNGIFLPAEATSALGPDEKLTLRLESAFFAGHPYTFAAGVCLLGLSLTLLALFRIPRKPFVQNPGLRYALPAFLLVIGAKTAEKITRFYGLSVLPFIAFLVVFHYFSWYVFYLEKLRGRPVPRPPQASATRFDRLLVVISTRKGFIATIIAMNVVSFTGAFSYQVLHVSGLFAYIFDLKYFLYFLVFHVTMSFAPKSARRLPAPAPVTA